MSVSLNIDPIIFKKQQQQAAFLRQFQQVTFSLQQVEPLKIYNEKEEIVWITPKARSGSSNNSFYAFNHKDFSTMNSSLNVIYNKEQRLKEQSDSLDWIKNFNRNSWLAFSRNSNEIEGIFDDFQYDLLDLNSKINGQLALDEIDESKFDKHEYFDLLLKQFQKAKQGDTTFIVSGLKRKETHKLPIEIIGQFLALKYVHKVAKDIRKQNISKEEEKRIVGELITEIPALLSGSEDIRLRRDGAIISNSKGSWVPVNEDQIKEKLDCLVNWLVCGNHGNLHPIEQAAIFHAEFERIHPFADGNGRTGRLLTNFILMRNNLPTISLGYKKREEYLEAMNNAVAFHDADDLIELISKEVLNSMIMFDICLHIQERKQKFEK